MREKRRKINAFITRRNKFVRKCAYADTVANFIFDKPDKEYQVEYWMNGDAYLVSGRNFISRYIEGRL